MAWLTPLTMGMIGKVPAMSTRLYYKVYMRRRTIMPDVHSSQESLRVVGYAYNKPELLPAKRAQVKTEKQRAFISGNELQ